MSINPQQASQQKVASVKRMRSQNRKESFHDIGRAMSSNASFDREAEETKHNTKQNIKLFTLGAIASKEKEALVNIISVQKSSDYADAEKACSSVLGREVQFETSHNYTRKEYSDSIKSVGYIGGDPALKGCTNFNIVLGGKEFSEKTSGSIYRDETLRKDITKLYKREEATVNYLDAAGNKCTAQVPTKDIGFFNDSTKEFAEGRAGINSLNPVDQNNNLKDITDRFYKGKDSAFKGTQKINDNNKIIIEALSHLGVDGAKMNVKEIDKKLNDLSKQPMNAKTKEEMDLLRGLKINKMASDRMCSAVKHERNLKQAKKERILYAIDTDISRGYKSVVRLKKVSQKLVKYSVKASLFAGGKTSAFALNRVNEKLFDGKNARLSATSKTLSSSHKDFSGYLKNRERLLAQRAEDRFKMNKVEKIKDSMDHTKKNIKTIGHVGGKAISIAAKPATITLKYTSKLALKTLPGKALSRGGLKVKKVMTSNRVAVGSAKFIKRGIGRKNKVKVGLKKRKDILFERFRNSFISKGFKGIATIGKKLIISPIQSVLSFYGNFKVLMLKIAGGFLVAVIIFYILMMIITSIMSGVGSLIPNLSFSFPWEDDRVEEKYNGNVGKAIIGETANIFLRASEDRVKEAIKEIEEKYGNGKYLVSPSSNLFYKYTAETWNGDYLSYIGSDKLSSVTFYQFARTKEIAAIIYSNFLLSDDDDLWDDFAQTYFENNENIFKEMYASGEFKLFDKSFDIKDDVIYDETDINNESECISFHNTKHFTSSDGKMGTCTNWGPYFHTKEDVDSGKCNNCTGDQPKYTCVTKYELFNYVDFSKNSDVGFAKNFNFVQLAYNTGEETKTFGSLQGISVNKDYWGNLGNKYILVATEVKYNEDGVTDSTKTIAIEDDAEQTKFISNCNVQEGGLTSIPVYSTFFISYEKATQSGIHHLLSYFRTSEKNIWSEGNSEGDKILDIIDGRAMINPKGDPLIKKITYDASKKEYHITFYSGEQVLGYTNSETVDGTSKCLGHEGCRGHISYEFSLLQPKLSTVFDSAIDAGDFEVTKDFITSKDMIELYNAQMQIDWIDTYQINPFIANKMSSSLLLMTNEESSGYENLKGYIPLKDSETGKVIEDYSGQETALFDKVSK